jgi:hypothetical protein
MQLGQALACPVQPNLSAKRGISTRCRVVVAIRYKIMNPQHKSPEQERSFFPSRFLTRLACGRADFVDKHRLETHSCCSAPPVGPETRR